MIAVTRLDGTRMIVNCEQIACIEYQPDTVISLMNGEKFLVREGPDVVVERVREYRAAVLALGRRSGRAPATVLAGPGFGGRT